MDNTSRNINFPERNEMLNDPSSKERLECALIETNCKFQDCRDNYDKLTKFDVALAQKLV